MTLKEIESNLPNGLHDAQVNHIAIDYVNGTVKFALLLWTGDLSAQDEAVREKYESAELVMTGMVYFIIEPPDRAQTPDKVMPITIGAGSATEQPIKTNTILPKDLPDGAFSYWFFVHEWNSFIHIAAMDASINFKNN